MIGDITGATDGLPDPGRPVDGGAFFSPYTMLASASVEAAKGRTAEAGRLLLEGAALAGRQGQTAVEALLLHHGMRFGLAAQVDRRLRELARHLDAPLVEDFAAHAEAVAAADGVRLDGVSDRFRQRGALLSAADAALEAACVHDRQGARRTAAESRTKAHVYTKFGITSRTELVATLALASPGRRERVPPSNGRRLFGP